MTGPRKKLSRIKIGYSNRFRFLLSQINARKLNEGTEFFWNSGIRLSRENGLDLILALEEVYLRLLRKIRRCHLNIPNSGLLQSCSVHSDNRTKSLLNNPRVLIKFFCDGGLGGVARWLRAAGYSANWNPGLTDEEITKRLFETGEVLLTTDSLLLERRYFSAGLLRALWLPPTLKVAEQMKIIFSEFSLDVRESLCMECGGNLRQINKQDFVNLIPPRTFRWLDEFFMCEVCSKVYWKGTHWVKIRKRLESIQKYSSI
jgi:uncharacterized protein with PIN domain